MHFLFHILSIISFALYFFYYTHLLPPSHHH